MPGRNVHSKHTGGRAGTHPGICHGRSPAKLFGLYPQKGTIAVGSDADLIVFDPNREETISAKTHHMRVDYSMFEGIRTKGAPKLTMSRGRVIIENGKFTGRPGAGSFLRRKTYAAV